VQKDAISVNADGKLLAAICDVVHQYYGIVPYSWALRYAYNQAYGAAWARGESPTTTPKIKLNGWLFWMTANVKRFPRAAKGAIRELGAWLRESWRAAA
jgi:hypothetical protein